MSFDDLRYKNDEDSSSQKQKYFGKSKIRIEHFAFEIKKQDPKIGSVDEGISDNISMINLIIQTMLDSLRNSLTIV